ncbi:MAG: ATP-binding protein [Undibacterium sp.]|nr:ATP-binding protein [Undibacterium sp.]
MAPPSFHKLLIGLVLLTLLSLYAHANWMVRTLRIDNAPGFAVSVVDDRAEGGKSVSKLIRQPSGTVLECDIRPAYQWPFCELDIRFSQDDQGLDLSKFDSLRLSIRAQGPGAHHPIRVFLRNFDPAYSKPNSGASLKPHEIVFDPSANAHPVEFKLAQFMVASWWVQEHPTGIEHLGPQLTHVTTLGIATGADAMTGQHQIVLESAELRGLWVSQASFRLGIIFVWLICISIFLILNWKKSRNDLRQSDRLRQELRRSNEALESRVEERTRALSNSNARLIETLQNLDSARKELVQNEKNAALGSLVAGIAHEMNTPIGNALLIASTLTESVKTLQLRSKEGLTRSSLNNFIEDAIRGTAILDKNLNKAATLINSFKQLSADQHSGQRRVFLLADIMHETMLAMAPRLRQSSHQLELDIPASISMDSYPGPLSQIIINFINNALLHGFEGRENGKMRLQAQCKDERVLITFSDNGIGISAQVLRRVFEPFFTTKLGKGGSGLGMHIVHNIVTQVFGGQITIDSSLGQGTTIHLELPLQSPAEQKESARIAVPVDVAEDYQRFLDGREIATVTYFGGQYGRRDVVELALFMREMHRLLPEIKVELISIDSYAEGIAQLRAGQVSALATTSWLQDLAPYSSDIIISEALLEDGQSIVGLYTRDNNARALALNTLDDLRALKIASNKDWSADWHTLAELGMRHCLDVKTWRQMIYLVSGKEADILLAPFPSSDNLNIEFDGCVLIPIPGRIMVLRGSRHFAAAHTKMGYLIAEIIFPALNTLVSNGEVKRALTECGFLNESTAKWQDIAQQSPM